ncbi:hypothetical protein OC861_006909, partial [Tilletia horrida]
EHPEKAALIKRLHIDPVARTQNRDATDCDAYTAILQQCSSTVEELAIAVNCSNGDKLTFRVSDSKNQVLQRIAKARMPQLKHLMLKFNDLGHLDWIAWDQLNSLEEVTVLTEYLFHPDAEFIDFEDVTEDPEDNNILEVLLRLPSTVKRLTFAFVYPFEFFNLGYGVRNETSTQHRMTRFVNILAFTLEHARNHGKLDHLENIRLVWTHDPDVRYLQECCLRIFKNMVNPLPQLRRCRPFEERCAERLAAELSGSDQEQSKGMDTSNFASGSKPRLNLLEVWVPPSYRMHYCREDEFVLQFLTTCCLETLWRSLLYGRSDLGSVERLDNENQY